MKALTRRNIMKQVISIPGSRLSQPNLSSRRRIPTGAEQTAKDGDNNDDDNKTQYHHSLICRVCSL
jgi:hypothetical protein